jgi:hypothetical protein
VKKEPSRFLCLPASRDQVSDIIDSYPHECVGIFVKTEPSRFLCLLRQLAENQVSDIMIRIFTNNKEIIREDGTIQVSLPPPPTGGESGFRYYDSDLHE